jgi:Mg2+/Co2+ transporter CorC
MIQEVAICDYYMEDKAKKHSRHIYDIYKLLPLVPQNENLKKLVKEVRKERAKNKICLSAQSGVDIPKILNDIVKNEVYKYDYENITTRILEEQIDYDTAIGAVRTIAESDMFDE